MKLTDLFEKYIMSVKKMNSLSPVFKNPSREELDSVMKFGIVRCIISDDNVYVFDQNKINYSDLRLKGIRAVLFFKTGNVVSIEIPQYVNDKLTDAESTIKKNKFLKQYNIDSIIQHNETD